MNWSKAVDTKAFDSVLNYKAANLRSYCWSLVSVAAVSNEAAKSEAHNSTKSY